MELLLLYLGTVAASFGMKAVNMTNIYKIAADQGYKIKHTSLNDMFGAGDVKKEQLMLFMPIINMFSALQDTINFNNEKHFIVDHLRITDSLESMDAEEEEIYKEKPNGFTAFSISIISEKNKQEMEELNNSYKEETEKEIKDHIEERSKRKNYTDRDKDEIKEIYEGMRPLSENYSTDEMLDLIDNLSEGNEPSKEKPKVITKSIRKTK